MALYVDASAAVKLLVGEPESAAVEAVVAGEALASSLILAVEVRLAVRRRGIAVEERVADLLSGIALLPVTRDVVARAGRLAGLRTLDAIHVATALDALPAVDALLAYDLRLLEAARAAGLAVLSPGA